jgi:hypothetical protein
MLKVVGVLAITLPISLMALSEALWRWMFGHRCR